MGPRRPWKSIWQSVELDKVDRVSSSSLKGLVDEIPSWNEPHDLHPS